MVAEASGDAASAAALPRVTVNSDDPAVFGSSLTDECELVATAMGLGAPALRLLAADAVEACFLDAPGKQRLHERLQAAWKDYEATSI
jgi:aminodeoxyfutalosine deaminase